MHLARSKGNLSCRVGGLLSVLGVLGLLLVGCEKLPPSGPPSERERQVIDQRVQAYFRRAVAVGSTVTMSVIDIAPAPLGLLTAQLELTNGTQTQKIPIVVSRDGQYLVQGMLTDLTLDPFKATMEKISLKDAAVRGKADARVTIIEFSDLQCPFCARAYKTLEEEILKEYGERVRFAFKNYPLTSHPWAEPAALASLCARLQKPEAFWKLYAYFFENQKDVTAENVRDKALAALKDEGLDLQAFASCVEEKKTSVELQAEMQEAAAVGVRSTPTFFINGRKLEGALPAEQFKTAIEEALADASAKSP